MPVGPRRGFDPAELGPAVYPLLNSVVVPRPIAWVATLAEDGTANLAPHSYFTISSVAPPVVQFTSVGRKDSLRNVLATEEFTVSVCTEPLAELVNVTGTDYPPDMSEFAAAGLTAEPSFLVGPPRVAESPVSLECRLLDTRTFGSGDTSSTVVFGQVVHLSVAEGVLSSGDGSAHAVLERLRPVARLGQADWGTVGRVFALRRVPYSETTQGRS